MEMIALILGGIVIFFMFLYFVPVNLWITALFAGVKIEFAELIFMRVRRSPVKDIIHGLVSCTKAGVIINRLELEAHALAGGDVTAVTKAMIKAKASSLEVTFKEVSSVDLAGNDLSEFLVKKKDQTQSSDSRFELCRKIMNEFKEDQVLELEKYASRFN